MSKEHAIEVAREVIFQLLQKVYPWAMASLDTETCHLGRGKTVDLLCIRCQQLTIVFFEASGIVFCQASAEPIFSLGRATQVFHRTSGRLWMPTWISIQQDVAKYCSRIITFDVLEELGREKPGKKPNSRDDSE